MCFDEFELSGQTSSWLDTAGCQGSKVLYSRLSSSKLTIEENDLIDSLDRHVFMFE